MRASPPRTGPAIQALLLLFEEEVGVVVIELVDGEDEDDDVEVVVVVVNEDAEVVPESSVGIFLYTTVAGHPVGAQ